MNYNEITNPEQLLKYMDCIEYGVFDKNKNVYYSGDDKDFEYACLNVWELSSPEELLKNKVGHCWDQVELEREFFKNNNYEFKTFFIWFKCSRKNTYPTHTYLLYKDKETKQWCWFEHSDCNNKGIHMSKSLRDIINLQKQSHIKYAKSYRKSKTDINKIEILEYKQPPYDIDMEEFMSFVLTAGKNLNCKVIQNIQQIKNKKQS